MTQTELASRVGTSQGYICEILKYVRGAGHGRPSPEMAARLEKVTGIHRLHWLYPSEFDEKGKAIS